MPFGTTVTIGKTSGRFYLDVNDWALRSVTRGVAEPAGTVAEVPLFAASVQVESAESASGPWTAEMTITESDGYRLTNTPAAHGWPPKPAAARPGPRWPLAAPPRPI